MVDAVKFKPGMQVIPGWRFVGIQRRLRRDLRADEIQRIGFRREHARQGLTLGAALADDDNHLALAGTVRSKAPVLAILAAIGRLHVSAEIAAVYLSLFASAADRCLPDL